MNHCLSGFAICSSILLETLEKLLRNIYKYVMKNARDEFHVQVQGRSIRPGENNAIWAI